MNMKPLMEDLLTNKDLYDANKFIYCIKKCHFMDIRKYQLFMYLTPRILDAEVDNSDLSNFFDFFIDYHNMEDEMSEESILIERRLKYTPVKSLQRNKKHYYHFARDETLQFDSSDSYLVNMVRIRECNKKTGSNSVFGKMKENLMKKIQDRILSQIQFTYIDFWAYNLSNKIKKLTKIEEMELIETCQMQINDLEISKFTQLICNLNEENIERMGAIRHLIDYQFNQVK